MGHNTFLVVCAGLIAVPFVVSTIKGNPIVGFVAGIVSFLVMAFAAGQGASMFEVHLIGTVVAALGVGFSLHGR